MASNEAQNIMQMRYAQTQAVLAEARQRRLLDTQRLEQKGGWLKNMMPFLSMGAMLVPGLGWGALAAAAAVGAAVTIPNAMSASDEAAAKGIDTGGFLGGAMGSGMGAQDMAAMGQMGAQAYASQQPTAEAALTAQKQQTAQAAQTRGMSLQTTAPRGPAYDSPFSPESPYAAKSLETGAVPMQGRAAATRKMPAMMARQVPSPTDTPRRPEEIASTQDLVYPTGQELAKFKLQGLGLV